MLGCIRNLIIYRYHSQLSSNRCGGWQQRHFPYNQIKYCNWAKNEGYEGDNCARMQGNGIDQNRDKLLWQIILIKLVVVCVLWLIDDTFGFLGKWRDTVCTKSTRHCTLCQIQKMLTDVAPSYDPSVPFHALPSYHSRVGYVFNIKWNSIWVFDKLWMD